MTSRVLVLPDGEPRGALLVLSGSSGRVQKDRCEALAAAGYAALSFRWFGEAPQPEQLLEVPLESFLPHLDRLHDLDTGRLGVLGTSFGAAAALLLGIADPRLDLVVALAPSSVVFAGPVLTEEGRPVEQSAFTWRGDPLHFVPAVDQSAWTGPELTTPRQVWEASLRTFPGRIEPARIAVEEITAQLIVAAGGDDVVWPSAIFADEIAERRSAYGLDTTVLIEPAAGHRVILPGEVPAEPTQGYAYGGSPEADARLGHRVLDAMG